MMAALLERLCRSIKHIRRQPVPLARRWPPRRPGISLARSVFPWARALLVAGGLLASGCSGGAPRTARLTRPEGDHLYPMDTVMIVRRLHPRG